MRYVCGTYMYLNLLAGRLGCFHAAVAAACGWVAGDVCITRYKLIPITGYRGIHYIVEDVRAARGSRAATSAFHADGLPGN